MPLEGVRYEKEHILLQPSVLPRYYIVYLLRTEWRITCYVTTGDLIGAGNGSPPVRWQPITWNHAALLSNGRNVEELHNNKFDQLISIS